MSRAALVLLLVLLALPSPDTALAQSGQEGHGAHDSGAAEDAAEVERVVEEAYVQGIHALSDPDRVRAGFHPDFVMKVRTDAGLASVTRDEWIGRLGPTRSAGERDVRAEYDLVDVTGNTAVVKLRLFVDGQHRFTDYLSLYRMPEGWQIVAKVFEGHR